MFLAADEIMSSKKPAAERKKPAAKKMKAPLASVDNNSMDGEYHNIMMTSTSTSTSAAMSSLPTETYTIQPMDSGFSYSYTKNEKNIIEVDIHCWGDVTNGTFQMEMTENGLYLKWCRATPPTYFYDTHGDDTALRNNDSNAVAHQSTVWKLRTRSGVRDVMKYHFGDNWQYFKLPEPCRKILDRDICKAEGAVARGSQQYNSIVRVFLLARDQYKLEQQENTVKEVYFGGGGDAGGGGGQGGSGGGGSIWKYKEDDDNNNDDSSSPKKPRAARAKGGGAAGGKKRTTSYAGKQEPPATAPCDTKHQVKSEYVKRGSSTSYVSPIEIVDSDDDADADADY